MIEILLPDSGYTAVFRTGISYGQNLEIERVQFGMAKASDDGKPVMDVGGYVDYKLKIVEVMVAHFMTKAGEDGEPEKLFATVPVIRDLSVADGEILEKKAMELYEDLKKKPVTTPTE